MSAFFDVRAAKAFIEALTGYAVQDDGLLTRALDISGLSPSGTNRRPAHLGDRVLHLALADEWYPSEDDLGTIGHLDTAVGSNSSLHRYGHAVGLSPHIIINPGGRGQPIGVNNMAATVEAILATIWLDSGNDIENVQAAINMMGLRGSAT